MEPILLIVAVTYAVSGKHQKDRSLAAYRAGHEPEGLVKARLRHERGGGRFVTRPGTDKQKPKGPGATRLWIASRWANACEKSKTKGEDRLKRWQAWYEEQAPDRDEAWRAKQRKKMDNRADRLDKWQGRWTAVKNTAANAKATAKNAMSRNDETGENAQPETPQPAEESSTSEPTEQPPAPEQPDPGADTPTNPPAESTPANTNTTSTGTGDIVEYKQAATALRAAAERVEQFRNDLSAMADGLGGKKWGEEVHGQIRDMDNTLHDIAANYRDKAGQMQSEGDNVNNAEDAHPYVPGPEVVNA